MSDSRTQAEIDTDLDAELRHALRDERVAAELKVARTVIGMLGRASDAELGAVLADGDVIGGLVVRDKRSSRP